MPQNVADTLKYIRVIRNQSLLSHELHTEVLQCFSDRSKGLLTYVLFPEPSRGFSTTHHLLLFYKMVCLWHDHDIRCTGFSTDSCSTGLGAGIALMTPTPHDVANSVLFLGLKDVDFVLLARVMGGKVMPDGQHFDFCAKWYGESDHLARTIRRNLTYDTRELVMTLFPNGMRLEATMKELSELKEALGDSKDGKFLTEIISINQWRDQKGDAAYAMLQASTIMLLKKVRSKTHHATAVYLTAFNHLLEPYINPNMTNPLAIVCSVWVGYSVLRLWEIYIAFCLRLDRDLYLPSYQCLRTAKAMAHAATTHVLDLHRNYRHKLDQEWSQGSLRGINTRGLEGKHSEARTGSVSKSTNPVRHLALYCAATRPLSASACIALLHSLHLPPFIPHKALLGPAAPRQLYMVPAPH